MYKLSKSVTPGTLVSLRGDKFIRCSGKASPRGVYVASEIRKTILFSGERVETSHPEGIVCYGNVTGDVAPEVNDV